MSYLSKIVLPVISAGVKPCTQFALFNGTIKTDNQWVNKQTNLCVLRVCCAVQPELNMPNIWQDDENL